MYRTIDCATWDDPWFAELSPNGKLLFLYFITNRRTSAAGCFEITRRAMMFESGIRGEALDAALDELTGRVTWWPDLQVVFVHNFYKHQRANSNKENFRKSALKALADFPESVQQTVGDAYPELRNGDVSHTEPITIPSHTHGDKETVTETDTETEQKGYARARARATQLDPDFEVSERVQVWCKEQQYAPLKVERERVKFVNHFVANGERKKDWDRTFMNWLMNGEDRGWADVKAVTEAERRRGVPA